MNRMLRIAILSLLVMVLVLPQAAHAAPATDEVTPQQLLATPDDTDFSDGTFFVRQDLGTCDGFISVGKGIIAGQDEVHWSAYVYCPEWARVIAVASAAAGGGGVWPGVPGAGLGDVSSFGEFFLPATYSCFTITAVGQMAAGESKTMTTRVCSSGIV